MKNRTITLGLVQMSMTGNAAENMKKAIKYTEEAAKKGADLVVLPELFLGPYFCQRFQRSEHKYIPNHRSTSKT